jgi:hypothetical protein
MKAYRVFPHNKEWVVLKARAKKATGKFKLRRDAIACARKLAGRGGVVTVHNSAGLVVIRIPEQLQVAAAVHIKRAADMTPEGRAAIASWLRQHGRDLVQHGREYAAAFRGRYYCPA